MRVCVSNLHNDVQYEPHGPVVAVVATQQCSQRQEEAPGQVHQHTVEVHKGEVDSGAVLLRAVSRHPRQLPHVRHHQFIIAAECGVI